MAETLNFVPNVNQDRQGVNHSEIISFLWGVADLIRGAILCSAQLLSH
jgi:hypothetical protein